MEEDKVTKLALKNQKQAPGKPMIAGEEVSVDAFMGHIGVGLSEDFGDPETLLNSRDWLEKAITNAGAKITDGGVGMGQADLGILLEGMPYSISIKPRNPAPKKEK